MFYTILSPHRLLLRGFISVIIIGSYLLALPIASATGNSQPFLDTLFTATSAVSTTGLTIVDVGSFYSLCGQIVLSATMLIGRVGPLAIGYSIRGRCKIVPIKYPKGVMLIG
ncbi:MAG: hypothetical protein F9K48_05515 [Candidatus Brocadia sp.]|nr:MAG: hypothetical protein F9K48_05515 [Candidatus Brocadia sp.]